MAIRLDTSDGDFAIWTVVEDGSLRSVNGRCIGTGKTLDEAKLDAIGELHGDIADVEALTEDDEDDDAN
jgi:hypothetical protein